MSYDMLCLFNILTSVNCQLKYYDTLISDNTVPDIL